MRKRYFSCAVIAMGLVTGSCAHAALLVSASVGGAPTGVNHYNVNADVPSGTRMTCHGALARQNDRHSSR